MNLLKKSFKVDDNVMNTLINQIDSLNFTIKLDNCASDLQKQDILESFMCPICHDVVRNPKECSQCNELFCGFCIDKWS